jgi:uncharacterized membrane protein YidH (DUF202 family)
MPSPDRPAIAVGERTALAWERSALAYASLAAVVLGIAAHRGLPGLLVVTVVLLVVALLVWRQGRRAYDREAVVAQPRALRLIALTTALVAVAAAVVVIVPG